MSSPLSIFRRHQKLLLAIFGVVIMITFTVGGIVTRYQTGQERGRDNVVVVAWKHGKVTEADLALMHRLHVYTVRFLSALVQQTFEAKRFPKVATVNRDETGQLHPGIQVARSEQDLVQTMLLARKAEDMGVTVTDQAIFEFLKSLTDSKLADGRLDGKRLEDILSQATGEALGFKQLFYQLRIELAAQQMRLMSGSALLPMAVPPEEAWDYYNRLNRRVKVELLPLKADAFLRDVKAGPTDADITKLYEEAKDRYAEPNRPEPGFKRRHKIVFQYIKGDYEAFLEKEKAAITDAQVAEYYEKYKDEFKEPETPPKEEPTGAKPAPDGAKPPAKPEAKSDAAPAPKTEPKAGAKPDEPKPPPQPAPKTEAKPAEANPTPKPKVKADAKPEPKAEAKPAEANPTPKPEVKADAKPEPKAEAKPAEANPTPKPDAKPEAKPATGDAPKTSARSGDTVTFVSLTRLDGTASDEPPPAAAKEAPAAKPAEAKPTEEKKPAAKADAAKPEAKPETKPESKVDAKSAAKPEAKPESKSEAKPEAKPGAEKPVAGKEDAKSKPTKYKPLDAVKDEIRGKIARPLAQKKVDDALNAARTEVDVYFKAITKYNSLRDTERAIPEPEPLDHEKLAEKLGLIAGETPLVDELEITAHEIGESYRFSLVQQQPRVVPFAQIAYAESLPRFRPDLIESFRNVRYVYWKFEEKKAEVPELDDAVREEVTEFWKRRRAFELAKAEAERLAKEWASKGNVPLKDTVPTERAKDVLEPDEFSWLSYGSVPRMSDRRPSLGLVRGVEAPGEGFMRAVGALKPGQIGVAANRAETIAFVVRLVSESPPETQRRDQFLQTGLTQDSFYQAAMEREPIRQAWLKELDKELKVDWKRESHPFGRSED